MHAASHGQQQQQQQLISSSLPYDPSSSHGQQEHYAQNGAYGNSNHMAQYQQQQQQPGMQPIHAPQPPAAAPMEPRMVDADVMYFGHCWIPIEVFPASDLRERIAGAGDSHFGHILTKHGRDVLELGFEGLPNAQAPPNQRLKVTMKSPNYATVRNAFADLLDLVQTMVELVAEELGTFQSWQIEQIGAQIRTEMFVMNHGVRSEVVSRSAHVPGKLDSDERNKTRVEVMNVEESVSDDDEEKSASDDDEVNERDKDHRIMHQQQQQQPAPPARQAELPAEDGEYELVSDEDDDNAGGSTGSESDLTDHEGDGKYQPF